MKINRKQIMILFIYSSALLNKTIIFSGEKQQKDKPVIIAVPGILAADTGIGYSENILALISPDDYHIHKTGTLCLAEKPDFAQQRCMSHLSTAIEQYKNNSLLFICTSQGSATTTNYIAQCNSNNEKTNWTANIKGIICEGYPASFNQCLTHSLEQDMPYAYLLPWKHYWFPYVTTYFPYFYKTFFPFVYYNPAAQQPFHNLKKIPKDIPIILIHCKQDRITPYDGVMAAYHQLISEGHYKTYLISVSKNASVSLDPNKTQHINVIEENTQQQRDLTTMITALLNEKPIPQEIGQRYQPDNKAFTTKAKRLKSKEKIIQKIDLLLTTLKYFTFLYAALKTKSLLFKNIHARLSSIKKEELLCEAPLYLF